MTSARVGSMAKESLPPPEDEVLTEKQCAARLSVTRETLSRLRHDRDDPLPSVRLNKKGSRPRIRYIWGDVVAWMRGRDQQAAAPRRRGRPRNVDLGGRGQRERGR